MKDDRSPYLRIAELEKENRRLYALLKPELRASAWLLLILTSREYDILCAIAAGDGKPVSSERIRWAVWGAHPKSVDLLRLHIFNLRNKLRAQSLIAIHNNRSFGYWLDEESLRIVRNG